MCFFPQTYGIYAKNLLYIHAFALGEKGRPDLKRKEKTSPGDKSGESGEKADKRTNHKTGTTKDRLGIDQTIELKELGQELPPDAHIRYWEERVVQDVELRRNTVKYRIAVWYSPSEGRTYRSSVLLFEHFKVPKHYQNAPGAFWHALCWIHDGRDYKKLVPQLDINRQHTDALMDEYWKFYRRLLAYKDLDKAAQNLQKPVLDAEFDRIFTRKIGYEALDKLLARTHSKKIALLPVSSHPNLPLHNNAAKLAARRKVRKRDVCFHTKSAEGTRMQDAYLSIIETAQKLGVSAFEYLTDFAAGSRKMTPLPKLIALKLSGHPIGF